MFDLSIKRSRKWFQFYALGNIPIAPFILWNTHLPRQNLYKLKLKQTNKIMKTKIICYCSTQLSANMYYCCSYVDSSFLFKIVMWCQKFESCKGIILSQAVVNYCMYRNEGRGKVHQYILHNHHAFIETN